MYVQISGLHATAGVLAPQGSRDGTPPRPTKRFATPGARFAPAARRFAESRDGAAGGA
jgi:hypothetical protein